MVTLNRSVVLQHSDPMTVRHQPIRRRVPAALGLTATVCLGLAACNSGEVERDATGSADLEPDEVPTLSVTVPAERLTPFCQGMIDLRDRLETDPPTDVRGAIVAAYTDLVDVVPPELEQDFLTVLARLQDPDAPGPTAPTTSPVLTSVVAETLDPSQATTTTPFADEGYVPDDDPALRVNQYVEFACTDSVNNPGPAATQPDDSRAP